MFSFQPKIAFVQADTQNSAYLRYFQRGLTSVGTIGDTTWYMTSTASYSGNTIRWYTTEPQVGVKGQYNVSGIKYYYFGLG